VRDHSRRDPRSAVQGQVRFVAPLPGLGNWRRTRTSSCADRGPPRTRPRDATGHELRHQSSSRRSLTRSTPRPGDPLLEGQDDRVRREGQRIEERPVVSEAERLWVQIRRARRGRRGPSRRRRVHAAEAGRRRVEGSAFLESDAPEHPPHAGTARRRGSFRRECRPMPVWAECPRRYPGPAARTARTGRTAVEAGAATVPSSGAGKLRGATARARARARRAPASGNPRAPAAASPASRERGGRVEAVDARAGGGATGLACLPMGSNEVARSTLVHVPGGRVLVDHGRVGSGSRRS
jgi:hypothetical protein